MELTDEQWTILEPLIPVKEPRGDGKGRPRINNRDVLNDICGRFVPEQPGKICRTGILPGDLP
jgi:transposase